MCRAKILDETPSWKKRARSMIITRSPLRICLGGGGTDLPSYYRQHRLRHSAAISRYVYITINEAFRPRIIVKYSKFEEVEASMRSSIPSSAKP